MFMSQLFISSVRLLLRNRKCCAHGNTLDFEKNNGFQTNTSLHPSLSHSIALIPFIILITRNCITKVNVLVTVYGFGDTRKHSVIFDWPSKFFWRLPDDSSGGRQIFLLFWRSPDNSHCGSQITLLAAVRQLYSSCGRQITLLAGVR